MLQSLCGALMVFTPAFNVRIYPFTFLCGVSEGCPGAGSTGSISGAVRALFRGPTADVAAGAGPAGIDPVTLQVLNRKSSFQEVSLRDSPR